MRARLISAILLLLNQAWRNSINRFAEAMTLFAVACAGMFPLLHLGRPWLFYWLLPYPNTMTVQPQFRSPLVWDVFAVSTYAMVSLLFWYLGMIPDLATLRDRSTGFKYGLYGCSLVWVARRVETLEMAAKRLTFAGGACNPAGFIGPHSSELRLHHCDRAGLAFHDIPALLCRRRYLFGVRHGSGSLHSVARGVWPEERHH